MLVYGSVLFLLLFSVNSYAKKNQYLCNNPPSCGDFKNISYPFGLEGDPKECGDLNYLLACENNTTLVLNVDSAKYLVKSINPNKQTIRVVDPGFQEKNCSSLPLYPLTFYGFNSYHPYYLNSSSQRLITYMNCENPVNSSLFLETAPCASGVSYSYVIFGDVEVREIPDMCRIYSTTIVLSTKCRENKNCSYLDIYIDLLTGFELSWLDIYCKQCRGIWACRFTEDYSEFVGCNYYYEYGILWEIWAYIYTGLTMLALAIGARCFCGMPCLGGFLIYKWRRRHLSMYDTVEDFLRSHNNLMPIMYTFSEIKKMSRGFKEKLGEGGYGSVYKGKLSSGRTVAIKILGKSKANGQDFINEVATIGRIHHYNVVQLIGFCAERSKRALVYDFMPNGSLEKYVLSREEHIHLSWKQMHEISLGVARGIDYLHRGCEMQILHFDIKPHNILLDENFVPKVADFGLAKLRATSDNTLTLTAARGTIGYIAPELFYKNIGRVSHKADVYSFGMLLLEMVGKKKNTNAEAEHSSQTYFPDWVYNEVANGKVSVRNAEEDEENLVEKMVTAALWCIQMKPSDRPSMNKVVEMLESNLESLPIPPKPSFCPVEKPLKLGDCTDDGTWSSSMLYDTSDSSSLLMNSDRMA